LKYIVKISELEKKYSEAGDKLRLNMHSFQEPGWIVVNESNELVFPTTQWSSIQSALQFVVERIGVVEGIKEVIIETQKKKPREK
jgi:hypothetical protein